MKDTGSTVAPQKIPGGKDLAGYVAEQSTKHRRIFTTLPPTIAQVFYDLCIEANLSESEVSRMAIIAYLPTIREQAKIVQEYRRPRQIASGQSELMTGLFEQMRGIKSRLSSLQGFVTREFETLDFTLQSRVQSIITNLVERAMRPILLEYIGNYHQEGFDGLVELDKDLVDLIRRRRPSLMGTFARPPVGQKIYQVE